ncbi:class I glutamine amidotransferase-like protein [Marasmius fiardii PR-910]|nr:class I glutamine amidotransferase-like protein [Marasmius fiardii PR-910]
MSSESKIKVYRMAVCLYPGVTMLDFQGPVDILCSLSLKSRESTAQFAKTSLPDIAIEAEYLSHTTEPVTPYSGAQILPSMTYEQGLSTDFGIILIPGGPNHPKELPPAIFDFLKKKSPKAEYVLSVCTGSWILAAAGILNGKRATTNKALYRIITEDTKDLNITWVPKARWVVNDDKHIWTASGVTAGMDLAYAFLVHLAGEKVAEGIKGVVEFRTVKDSEEDEFAIYHGLV